MNQHNRKAFDRITYSMDMSNPDALAVSKGIENLLKNAVRQLQQEGAEILRTPRTKSGSMRSTDYYVPAGYGANIQNVVAEEIARISSMRERLIGVDVSSASNVSFREQATRIRDAQIKAQVERTIRQNGGYFSTDADGISRWGIDPTRTMAGPGGRQRSVAASVSSTVGASNMAWKRRYEDLIARYTGERVNINGMSQDEVSRLGNLASEKQMVYDRISRRDRMVNYRKQYDEDNPNDPEVVKRREAKKKAEKEERGEMLGAGGRFIVRAVTTLVTMAAAAVAGIGKMVSAVIDLRDSIRGGNTAAMLGNLSEDQVSAWQKLATSKHLSENTLYSAAGSMMSKFGDATFLNSSSFNAIAPLLRGNTADLVGMAAGGDQNALAMLDMVASTVLTRSRAGMTPSGMAKTPTAALGVNIAAVGKGLDSSVSNLLTPYLYDVWNGQFSGSLQDWLFQKAPGGKAPDIGGSTQTQTTRKAAEEAGDAWLDTMSQLKSMFDGIKAFFASDFAQFAADARRFFALVADKIFHDARPAAQLTLEAIDKNAATAKLVAANLPAELAAAKSALAGYGVSVDLSEPGSARKLLDSIKSGTLPKGMSAASRLRFMADGKAVYALQLLADTQATQLDLKLADTQLGQGVVPIQPQYDPAIHAVAAARDTMGYRAAGSGALSLAASVDVDAYIKEQVAKTSYDPMSPRATYDSELAGLKTKLFMAAASPLGEADMKPRLDDIRAYFVKRGMSQKQIDAAMKGVIDEAAEVRRVAGVRYGSTMPTADVQGVALDQASAANLLGSVNQGLLGFNLPGLSGAMAAAGVGSVFTATPQGGPGAGSVIHVVFDLVKDGKKQRYAFDIPNGVGLTKTVKVEPGTDIMDAFTNAMAEQNQLGK